MDLGGATEKSGRKMRGEPAVAGYKLDQFFNITPDLLCIADRECRLVELNSAWEAALGYRPSDVRGQKVTDLVHPDDHAAVIERLALHAPAKPRTSVHRFRHADGSFRWLEWHSSRKGNYIYWAGREITERKASEERLYESEARWRQLFEELPDALLLLDDTSGIPVIADCNAALCTVTGYTRDELIGEPIMKLRPPEVTEADVRRRATIVREAGHLTFEIEYLRKDGSRFPIEAAVTTIRIDGRDMSLVVERDISARKAAEKALRESEERFAEFMDRVPALCFVKDSDSRFVYLNRQFREAHDAGDWLGKTDSELWSTEEARRLSRIDHLVLDLGEQVRVEEDFPVRDRTHSFLTAKFPMRGPDGERLVGGVSIDITEQKRAERALRDSESRWKELFDRSPDGMLLLDDSDGLPVIADCNPAICSVSGYAREELIGQPILMLTSERVAEEEVRGRFERVRRTGTIGFETEHRRKDGSTFPVEIATSRVHLDGREMTLTIERDISARKAAEAALREQDRILRDAQQVARVGSWHWVAATDTITWSEEYHRIIGHDPALPPPGYEEHLAWYTPESAARLQDAVLEAMVSGTPYELDLDLVRPDGVRLAVIARGEAVRDASGDVVILRGTLQDITERKQVEAALEESERRLRLHIENTPVAVIEWDTNFDATSWNPAAERIFGYSAEEALGRHGSIILPEMARPRVTAVFASLLEGRGGQHSTNQNVTKDGRLLVCEWFNTPLTSADGRVVGVASIAKDVTQRVAAEQALRESEERFRAAIEAIPVAVVGYDGERLVLANHAATVLSGFTIEEILTEGFLERVLDAESLDMVLARSEARFRGEPAEEHYELRLTRKDERQRIFEASTALVWLGGRPISFVAASDVTDRRHYEDQLRRLNEELEERVVQRTAALAEAKERAEAADRAKSTLLSRASHELRTPLNSILGFAQLLALDELSADQYESVEHILDGGSHLLGLVDEILDLARIETGRLALSLEPTDLAALVREAIQIVTPLSRERHITLDPQRPDSHGPWAHADRQRLKQVLLNLLSNAIKYNSENGAVIVRAYERPDRTMRLTVTDTGPGIAGDKLGLLFNPFERLGAEATGVQGTGLGLALSRALTEAMGGRIGVESRPGAGSTFWVDLARADPPAAAEAPEERAATVAPATPPDKPQRVLYIEDNLENLRLVESLLKRWKEVTLIPAMQGQVGLDLAADQADLIVLDVHLPDLTGEEVLRQLKANPSTRGIPVIVASADTTPEQVTRMMDAGALHYFTKPLDVRQFLATLSQILGGAAGPPATL